MHQYASLYYGNILKTASYLFVQYGNFFKVRSNKILVYTQVLIIFFLTLCSGGISLKPSKNTGAFPCAEHQCGCKSQSDCETHCCCASHKGDDNAEEQKALFGAIIRSINCKYGDGLAKIIAINLKYALEGPARPFIQQFLCFRSMETTSNFPERTEPPTVRPPRHLS